MSIKATKKELKNTFMCIGCGYCRAHYLLKYVDATFYNYGVYGWNFSGYILTHSEAGAKLLLTTGYRNMIHNELVKNDYEIISKYEREAEAIANTSTREQAQQIINNLLDEIRTAYFEKLND